MNQKKTWLYRVCPKTGTPITNLILFVPQAYGSKSSLAGTQIIINVFVPRHSKKKKAEVTLVNEYFFFESNAARGVFGQTLNINHLSV